MVAGVTDQPLIAQLREQETCAAGVLVTRYYDRIHRYLARLLGDAAAAEDLTQETFLRAYQALPRLADDSHLAAWLFRIATNLARQHHRHHRLVAWTRLAQGDSGPDAAQLADRRGFEESIAEQEAVRQALLRLPLDHRACLLLYAWTGLTSAEIAPIVGKSAAAVRMSLVRARREFRAAYAPPEGGAQSGPSPTQPDTTAPPADRDTPDTGEEA